MKGILAAILTPLKDDGAIDHRRFAALGKCLLHEGCDGLLPFGTTGEFPSFSVRERMLALDAICGAGIPAGRIIIGTGASALPDVAELSRHAMDHGCAGVLVGPPFYFKSVTVDALYATYGSLIEAVGPQIRLYLYHFPEMTGLPIAYGLVERLQYEFPSQMAGLKDSAGDVAYSKRLIEDFPGLAVFTGDDDLLSANLRAGGAGSITAGANLAVRDLAFIRDNWRQGDLSGVKQIERRLQGLWSGLLLKYPVTEALKEILAAESGSRGWLNMRQPLARLDETERAALLAGYRALKMDLPPALFRL